MPVCVLPIMAPVTVAAHAHHAAARRPLFRQSECMSYSLERDAHDKRARALPEQPCVLALATFSPATTIMMALAAGHAHPDCAGCTAFSRPSTRMVSHRYCRRMLPPADAARQRVFAPAASRCSLDVLGVQPKVAYI